MSGSLNPRPLPQMSSIGFNSGVMRPSGVLLPNMNRPLMRPPGVIPQVQPRPPLVLEAPGSTSSAPTIVPPKQTTLYVGKIADSVEDSVIEELLRACGSVKSWKRMEDVDTHKVKAFGFCEFEDSDGVIRALTHLSNLKVGGQELLLKCNSGTQKYIEHMEKKKALKAQQQSEDGDDHPTEPSSADLDNAALEKIMAIVSNLDQILPPPPEARTQADEFLAKLKSEEESKSRHSSKDHSRSAKRESRDRQEEKDLERRHQKEREAERKEAEIRAHEQDQAYKTAVRKWEARERADVEYSEMRKAMTRTKDHERDISKERSRQCKADLDDPDADLPAWRRKLYAGSRQAVERKRWREKENEADEEDRRREAEEIAKKPKREEAESNTFKGHAASSSISPSSSHRVSNAHFEDPNDSITQAMMNAAKQPRKATSNLQSPVSQQPSIDPELVQVKAAKPKPVLAAFGDEEEDQPKRQLKKINYSEEEQRAAQQTGPNQKDKNIAIKALIAQVPTEQEAVFKFAVKWKAYDEGGSALQDKIKAWVGKKIAELLGQEEASIVDFIMSQLREHVSAAELLQEVQAFLDDEANPFVFKLYRMVIFETLKQEANLQD